LLHPIPSGKRFNWGKEKQLTLQENNDIAGKGAVVASPAAWRQSVQPQHRRHQFMKLRIQFKKSGAFLPLIHGANQKTCHHGNKHRRFNLPLSSTANPNRSFAKVDPRF
jgi:hypothetical protein